MLRWVVFALFVSCAASAQAAPCLTRIFEADSFTVCGFDSRKQDLRLVWKGQGGTALRSFARVSAELGPQAALVRFAMNAGMYQTNGMPLGLYIEDGKQRRPLNTASSANGNFYMKPNGVFSLAQDGRMRIDTADAFMVRSDTPQWATQSGPMLVIGGKLHPQITPDGPSRNLRNGVGISGAHTAFFVISDAPVSFGKLARFFRDGLGCNDALYFDGAVSSAWIPSQQRMDDAVPLGPMVVVLGRP